MGIALDAGRHRASGPLHRGPFGRFAADELAALPSEGVFAGENWMGVAVHGEGRLKAERGRLKNTLRAEGRRRKAQGGAEDLRKNAE
jgi:hypothetical protein